MMRRAPQIWMVLFTVALACVALASCGKLDLGGSGGGGPTPTPSPSGSPTPGACGTISPNDNVVVVAMANSIAPASTPTFGPVGGYSVVNLNDNTFPPQAQVIKQYVNASGTPAPITSNNVLQFANVETQQSPFNHSAVGFKGDAFPQKPHAFPSPLAMPTGTTISNSTVWSTGRIAAPLQYNVCLSQPFKLMPGTYFFGDLDFYNIANFKDVLIVGTPSPDLRAVRSLTFHSLPKFSRSQ